jgi:hypothetical protein
VFKRLKAWWRGLHELPMVYVTWHDGSSDWIAKDGFFTGMPVWAAAVARRDHWWQRTYHLDKETIQFTDMYLRATRRRCRRASRQTIYRQQMESFQLWRFTSYAIPRLTPPGHRPGSTQAR